MDDNDQPVNKDSSGRTAHLPPHLASRAWPTHGIHLHRAPAVQLPITVKPTGQQACRSPKSKHDPSMVPNPKPWQQFVHTPPDPAPDGHARTATYPLQTRQCILIQTRARHLGGCISAIHNTSEIASTEVE
ncbi:hypothetical protein ACLOJK_029558, partial [Asimina triloba]